MPARMTNASVDTFQLLPLAQNSAAAMNWPLDDAHTYTVKAIV